MERKKYKKRDFKKKWAKNTEKEKKIFEKMREIRTRRLESFLSEKKGNTVLTVRQI